MLSSFTLQASRVKRLKRIHSLFYLSRIAKLGLELVAGTEEVEGGNGGNGLLGRSGAQTMTLIVTEQATVGIKVPDDHT